MPKFDRQYKTALYRLLGKPIVGENGQDRRVEAFQVHLSFDMFSSGSQDGHPVPLLTSKYVNWRAALGEMLWFLKGHHTIHWLQERGIHIWDTWANEDGTVGPLYGYMWRHWWVDPRITPSAPTKEIDQISELIRGLKDRPQARSHVLTAWRPDWLALQSIKPCHILCQFFVDQERDTLDMAMYQRSCDLFLGVPFNLFQYAVLQQLVALHVGRRPGWFYWIGGDVHLYEEQLDAAREQLSRPRHHNPTPHVLIWPRDNIDDYDLDDFALLNYEHEGKIKAPVSAQGKPGQGVDPDKVRGGQLR